MNTHPAFGSMHTVRFGDPYALFASRACHGRVPSCPPASTSLIPPFPKTRTSEGVFNLTIRAPTASAYKACQGSAHTHKTHASTLPPQHYSPLFLIGIEPIIICHQAMPRQAPPFYYPLLGRVTAGFCVIDMLVTTILFLCIKDLWQTQVKEKEGGRKGGKEGGSVGGAWVYGLSSRSVSLRITVEEMTMSSRYAMI